MSTDLTRFRDHCRSMAAECDRFVVGLGELKPREEEGKLWTQLADEIDAYLHPDAAERGPVLDLQPGFDLEGL